MHIQNVIDQAERFSDLLPLAEQARVGLSFWGKSYAYVRDDEGTLHYEGTLHINALAERVLNLLKKNKYEFDETEREPGRRLAKRIDWIYDESDIQVEEANYFTKTVAIIRGLFEALFGFIVHRRRFDPIWGRWHQWERCQPNDDFDYYTEAQLRTVFNISPQEAEERYDYDFDIYENGIKRWQVIRPPHDSQSTNNIQLIACPHLIPRTFN